jgi:hypothetical protein
MSGATSGDWKRRHDGGLRHRQMPVNGYSPPSMATAPVVDSTTQGECAQHGKPQCVVRDDQLEAREGPAGRPGVAERFVVRA